MSEKCHRCGGQVRWRGVPVDDHLVCFDCARKALAFDTPENRAMVERIRSGESVEIRKVGGEWPEIDWCGEDDHLRCRFRLTSIHATRCFGVTFEEAAAAWNSQASGMSEAVRESCFMELDADKIRHEQVHGERDANGNRVKDGGI